MLPYRPRAVVVYAGANDLGWPTARKDASPASVLQSFQEFADLVHAELPDTWIDYLSINPEPRRWRQWPAMNEANELIRTFAQRASKVVYVDVSSPMLDARGKPRGDIWRWDGLHLNEKGYALLASLVRPVLLRQ